MLFSLSSFFPPFSFPRLLSSVLARVGFTGPFIPGMAFRDVKEIASVLGSRGKYLGGGLFLCCMCEFVIEPFTKFDSFPILFAPFCSIMYIAVICESMRGELHVLERLDWVDSPKRHSSWYLCEHGILEDTV